MTPTPVLNWTHHARQRLVEMQLTEREVAQVINDAEQTYTQSNYRGNQVVHQLGDLAVVTSPPNENKMVIITILWRSKHQWSRDEFVQHRLTHA